MKNKNTFFITLAALLVSPLFVSAQSWTGPSSSPPNGNTAAPLNVSSTAQSKIGGLLLNTGGATNGLIVQYGNVGIDTANSLPLGVLDVDVGTNQHIGFITFSGTPTLAGWNDGFTGWDNIEIAPAGNVGIGTAAPAYKLDVSGTANATQYCISGGNCITSWPSAGVSTWLLNGSNAYYNNGFVGVNTSSPQAPLSVAGGNDQLDFYHPNDNQFSIQTVLDGQSLSGYNYGGGQNQLFLQPDVGEVTIGTPTSQYAYPLYVNGSVGVNGNLHLVGGRSTIFTEGDNNTTQVGGLQIVTPDNGVHTILTPTDQNGNTINSTVQFGGGGAFNNNVVNLSVPSGQICLQGNCISSWSSASGNQNFGGMYQTASPTGLSRVNPYTHQLSCGSGYTSEALDQFQDLGGVTHTLYYCALTSSLPQ